MFYQASVFYNHSLTPVCIEFNCFCPADFVCTTLFLSFFLKKGKIRQGYNYYHNTTKEKQKKVFFIFFDNFLAIYTHPAYSTNYPSSYKAKRTAESSRLIDKAVDQPTENTFKPI